MLKKIVGGVGGVGGRRKAPRGRWIVERGPRWNFRRLARKLAEANSDLFRDGELGPGLILVLPDGRPARIRSAADLIPAIVDVLDIRMIKNGKHSGDMPSATILNAALRSDVFLRQFGSRTIPCGLSVVRQCRAAGIAAFVKQVGSRAVVASKQAGEPLIPFKTVHPKGEDPAEWPPRLRVQEFPR